MSTFNTSRSIFAGRYDNLNSTSALQRAAAILKGDGTVSTDTDGFLTGDRPMYIKDVQCTFRDMTFTDPNVDWHLGHKITYTVDGGANYVTALDVKADADCPMVWDDSVGAAGTDFVIDTPISLWAYKGMGAATKNAASPLTDIKQMPIRIPAHAFVRIEVGLYTAGTLVTNNDADLDSVEVVVFGTPV
jgi:hypothetical protein